MNRSVWRAIALVLSSLLAVVGCQSSPQSDSIAPTPSSSAIPIGVAVAQTSNLALLGQESVSGARLAERYFNQQGGVNGTPTRLIFEDAGGEEAGAINAFQRLINQHKVVGIVGPSSSQQAFSADPIAERAGVPVVGPTNTAAGVPQIGQFITRVAAPVTVLAPQSIQAALKLNPQIKRVAVFHAQNDAFSKSETAIFQQALKARQLEIVTVQSFQTTDTDFQTQATAATNLKPDLVVISSLTSDGANLVRQLRELGYNGLIVSGNGLNTPNIFPVCKALCDGILVAQAYSPEQPGAINQAFRSAYVQQYQKEPPQFSAQTFTAVQVVVEALRRLDAASPLQQRPLPELRRALNREILAGQYDTPLGQLAFTLEGEVIQKQFYVAQVTMDANGTTGKFVFLNLK